MRLGDIPFRHYENLHDLGRDVPTRKKEEVRKKISQCLFRTFKITIIGDVYLFLVTLTPSTSFFFIPLTFLKVSQNVMLGLRKTLTLSL